MNYVWNLLSFLLFEFYETFAVITYRKVTEITKQLLSSGATDPLEFSSSHASLYQPFIKHTWYWFQVQVQVQVELYCHSAACGDIQWNEMSCLTGPRCYINTDIQHYKPIHKLTYWQIWLGILYINVYPIQLKIMIENTNYTICLPYTTKDKDKKYKLYKLCECFT